ncbi:hypothetical protein BC828DRAFT_408240 [Blastocladiella britannica]|nr:hypothetical protein BC828DRAFT_408240 [Blastocladiella britannica]
MATGELIPAPTAFAASPAPTPTSSPATTSDALPQQQQQQHLTLSRVVGGQLSAHPPLFTADSAHFLCIASSSIKLYSVRTNQQIRVISPPDHLQSHTANITAVALSPRNPLQTYSASVDGSIRLWDINDGALLKVWKLGTPISHFRIHPKQPHLAFVVVTKSSGRAAEKLNSVLLLLDLSSNTITRLLKARYCSAFDVSQDARSVVLAARFKLHIGTIVDDARSQPAATATASTNGTENNDASVQQTVRTKPDEGAQLQFSWAQYMNDRKMTTVAAHPLDSVVATGDESGKIKVWSVLGFPPGQSPKDPVVRSFHWHARGVNHFTFTQDGRHMISGGDEGVLVIWHLETGQKQFNSQLGSPILGIGVSPDATQFAVGLLDNAIRIILASTLAVQQSVVGLKSTAISSAAAAVPQHGASALAAATDAGSPAPSFVGGNYVSSSEEDELRFGGALGIDGLLQSGHGAHAGSLPSVLTVEPRTGYIALEGSPGMVQFYDSYSDCHVTDLVVVPYNSVAGNRVAIPQVTRLAFDESGRWMATVDERPNAQLVHRGCTLRLWEYSAMDGRYELNSRVDALPRISGLSFRPSNSAQNGGSGSRRGEVAPMLATTQDDGTFSVWEVVAVPVGAGATRRDVRLGTTIDQWRCRSSGYFRAQNPCAVAWAADGSLLAVAFGPLVTLWDPATVAHVGTLVAPKPVASVTFASGNCPLLVAVAPGHVTVFDLLTLAIAWSWVVPKGHLLRCAAVCPRRDQIAIVTQDMTQVDTGSLAAAAAAAASVPITSGQTVSNAMDVDPASDAAAAAAADAAAEGAKSMLTLLSATSPVPLSVRTVPEDILSMAFIPSGGSNAADADAVGSASQLVYLTRSNKLAVLSATPAAKGTAVATAAVTAAGPSIVTAVAPRTSIFIRKPVVAPTAAENAPSKTTTQQDELLRGRGGIEAGVPAVLEAPAHAIPSVEAVFDLLMSSMLDLRVGATGARA